MNELFGKRKLQRDDPSWTLMGKPDEEPTVERWSSRRRRRIIYVSSSDQQSFLVHF